MPQCALQSYTLFSARARPWASTKEPGLKTSLSPLSPLPEPAQRVLVTTLKVVSVSEIVLTKATCCHRGRIQVFFQELGKRYGVPGPFCDKRIDVQYHAPAIRGKPPPPADVQFHPPVTHREIRHCGRFRKAIGTQVLLGFRAAVSLIKVDVQHAGICYVLLALPGREGLRLHPHQFEEVQHPLRKKEAEVVLVELCLCSILIHDYKGTSFHGIYLNGWILLSYQTRIFAGEPEWHTYSDIEVDAILGDAKVAIEIKSTDDVQTKHKTGLNRFSEEHPEARLILVSTDRLTRKTGNIELIYVCDFFKMLWAGEIY